MDESPYDAALTEAQLQSIALCEEILRYRFRDKRILSKAITHASIANTRLKSYERLEFLGDSILGFIVCEFLFQKYPDWLEGELTKVKSNVVSRQTCARIAEELKIEHCLIVGKGVGNSGRVPKSLLANALESIIGAMYLDGGIEAVKEFLIPWVETQVEEAVRGGLEVNYKSDLQQYSQKRYGLPPNYRLVGDRGPDHDKWFLVRAEINKHEYSPAWGKNKKEAEQKAAANALAAIDGDEPPFSEESP